MPVTTSSQAAVPEELEDAIVTAEPAGEAPESGVFKSKGGAQIAHVLAGDDGVEDVEVSVHCPHCSGSVLIDVAHEDAFMTALSLIAGPEPAPPEPGNAAVMNGEVPLAREVQHSLRNVPVARVMNPAVVFVRQDDPVAELPTVFAEHDDPVVVVTDQDNRPVGIARSDLVLRAAVHQTLAVHVAEVLEAEPYCLRADAPLTQALELFTAGGAREIVVIGDSGKLVGLLLPEDVLRAITDQR